MQAPEWLLAAQVSSLKARHSVLGKDHAKARSVTWKGNWNQDEPIVKKIRSRIPQPKGQTDPFQSKRASLHDVLHREYCTMPSKTSRPQCARNHSGACIVKCPFLLFQSRAGFVRHLDEQGHDRLLVERESRPYSLPERKTPSGVGVLEVLSVNRHVRLQLIGSSTSSTVGSPRIIAATFSAR